LTIENKNKNKRKKINKNINKNIKTENLSRTQIHKLLSLLIVTSDYIPIIYI